jgi:hypothetical protein
MFIRTLAENEVFVFGSNSTGFHGAGSAGMACRGDAANTWRNDKWFQAALDTPLGSPARVGKWAIIGVSRGFQVGREGKSYAIETVSHPGKLRSRTRQEIYAQLVELWAFIYEHPELVFVLTPIGEGYAGWTSKEMNEVWDFLLLKHGTPANIRWSWFRV